MGKFIIIFYLITISTEIIHFNTVDQRNEFKPALEAKVTEPFVEIPIFVSIDSVEAKAPGSVCVDCHTDVLDNEEVHSPAKKDCKRCHSLMGDEHPSKFVKNHGLAKNVPDLCYECHDPKNEEEFVHSPTAEGKCITCHSPHSSPNLYLVNADPMGPICLKCHELEVPEGNMVHQAVTDGQCQMCHNPHQADNELFFSTSNTGRICGKCHKKIRKAQRMDHVHKPFKKECFECHKGHSSKEAHLSDQKAPEMCLGCHEGMHNSLQNGGHVHQAIYAEGSCLSCHSPHSSVEAGVLKAKQQELCMTCHDKEIKTDTTSVASISNYLKKGNTVHSAISKVGCSGCHKPHVSEERALLSGKFPEKNYAEAKADNFALCFTCHKSELFEAPTDAPTNFRNNDTNLHYVHINGPKGRSCALCHNPHGAPNERLIADKAKFGNWDMPIGFKQFPDGGSCAPGCHEEKKYSRVELPDSLFIKKEFEVMNKVK